MAIKRALVVDDSLSARVALKKLLEVHDLDVELADSGEAALEYLKKDSADVIFMDHTMPGMDGLEAVSSIKANPRTATIPVMMYTTKEGEVYVGQARALGAVGVLPKNVQPHQLFDMLEKLGLVKERRGAEGARSPEENSETDSPADIATYEIPDPASPDFVERRTPPIDAVDLELEHQVVGISVEALVTRILEDQHLTLRSDILRGQKEFAREVAREMLVEQSRMDNDNDGEVDVDQSGGAESEEEAERVQSSSASGGWFWKAAAFVGLVVCGFLTLQFKSQRDEAYDQLDTALNSAAISQTNTSADFERELSAAGIEAANLQLDAFEALEWSLNEKNYSAMGDNAFNDALAERIQRLLAYLQRMGFSGEVRLISHLGRFCMMTDSAGTYELATPELSAVDCEHTGHRLEASSYVSDRLSVEFARLMRGPLANDIELNLIALDGTESQSLVSYPETSATAGEWNEIAQLNNRVQITLIPHVTP